MYWLRRVVLFTLAFCVVEVLGQGVIFSENFNSEGSLINWTQYAYPDDTPGSPEWTWTPYDGVDETGCVSIEAGIQYFKNDEALKSILCDPIKKIFYSDIIDITGYGDFEIKANFRVDNFDEVTDRCFLVVFDDVSGIALRIVSLNVNQPDTSWQTVQDKFPVDSSKFPYVRIGLYFDSPYSNSCTAKYFVDNVQLNTSAPPQTEILEPQERLTVIRAGSTVDFLGKGWDPEGSQLKYWWSFCSQGDNCVVEGNSQSFQFDELGVVEVLCWAEDDQGNKDPTPDRRYIRVVNNIKPQITSTSVRDMNGHEVEFRDHYAMINAGTYLTFRASAMDPDGNSGLQYRWRYYPDNDIVDGTQQVNFEFPEPGLYAVIFVATDNEGAKNYEYWKIRALSEGQNIPPMAQIVSPASGQSFQVGEKFDICGEVIDPDTIFDTCTGSSLNYPQILDEEKTEGDGSVYWSMNNGDYFEGIGAQGVSIRKEGRYQLSMLATDGRGFDLKKTQFSVVDPQTLAKPEITSPAQTLRIQPGEKVYFEGTVRSGSISQKSFIWEIRKRDTLFHVDTIRRTNLGFYTFNDPGYYEVILRAVHPFNESLTRDSDPREIWVEDIPVITGNDSFETAAILPQGQFRDNQITGTRYYRIQLNGRKQTIRLNLSYEGTATVSLLKSDRTSLGSQTFSGSTSFQVQGLVGGNYIIKFEPQSGKNSVKKDLSFGMGVSVANAGLYFPDIEVNSSFNTSIGLVNLSSVAVEAEVYAYDKNGGVLEQVPVRIEGDGRFSSEVSSLFPSSGNSIAWIRVDSNSSLNGYTLTVSPDGLESYATHGAEKLASDLYVPHIAAKTQQWYTLARVVNGTSESTDSSIVAGAQSRKLKNDKRFSKDEFNMLDKFEGSLPESEWGVFAESTHQISLAGVEVFGKVDGNRQTAGLLLDDNGQDNPNFTYVRNDIYFTHIARSVAQFWTGLAIVNTENQTATFKMIAYGDGGAVIGEKDFSLGPKEKMVDVAENILEGIGSPANVDWVKIQADQGIVGYELFGTHDNRRLAGLEGITGLKNKICFPYLDTTGMSWHGISVVNVSEASCNLTFKLMSDAGQVLAETPWSLAGNEKLVLLVTDLFGPLPANAGWVMCEGDQLLAGFELFGDLQGNSMAAVISR